MPIQDFWVADDLIPISQTKVKIPSENGLTFSEGQEINIRVPPTIQFIQPKQCYLAMDVQLGLPSNANGSAPDGMRTRLMLDEALGAQVLIRDITIRSGGAGAELLEQYQNYNTLAHVKYDYETNDNLKKKRALTEGSLVHNHRNRGTDGTTTSDKNDTGSNPWFKRQTASLAPADVATNIFGGLGDNFNDSSDLTRCRCLLPIQTGLFQTDKVLPILLTEGLHITIQLENNVNVFRQLDQCLYTNRLNQCPKFWGTDIAGAAATTGAAVTEVYLDGGNNLIDTTDTDISNCPFVVGEEINFVKATGADHSQPYASNRRAIIKGIETATSTGSGSGSLIKLTLHGTGASFTSNPPDKATGYVAYSTTCSREGSRLVGEQLCAAGTDYNARYRVSNVELILQQLEMPSGYVQKMQSMMKEGGQMRYDFVSAQNFKYSQLSSDQVANIRLPINFSKMKAILSVPTDASVYNKGDAIIGHNTYEYSDEARDVVNHSDQSGLVGVWDKLQDYQLFYDGKLNPSRKVSCAKISAKNSIDQQPIVELEKALAQSGIVPYSFRAFQRNAVIGRAVALHDGVYDARGRDFNLQVEYTGSTPDFNKLWHNWVTHIRTIVFSGDGIRVEM